MPDIVLTPGTSFQLRATLPLGIPHGGTFGIAEGALPAGVSLSSAGLLSVDGDATPVETSGVRFLYNH